MLFKDNLSSSLWPWHLSWLEVTSVIFAVVIGATELDVGYHLTVWVVSRSTFEEVVCWAVSCRQFHAEDVHCFKNKSKTWICRSETKVAQQRFSGWTTKKEQKHTLEHENFITSLQSTTLFHFVSHFHHLQISHFDSNLCWLASQFRRACLTMTRFTYFNHTANLSQVWPQAWSSWTTLTGPSLMLASLSVLVGVP